jgi:hypothetical protein
MKMKSDIELHPNAPASGSGPGAFYNVGPLGTNFALDKWMRPGMLDVRYKEKTEILIKGAIVTGGPLSKDTIVAINKAAGKTPIQWRRYVAYADKVKVGGSLAWRTNNPGNLRDAPTKIGTVPGAVGKFAVFASLEDGRAAQRNLYISQYGAMKVRQAINKLTPPTENDTESYLRQLIAAGVNIDQDVQSQIDTLMSAVEASEGLIEGIEIPRNPR